MSSYDRYDADEPFYKRLIEEPSHQRDVFRRRTSKQKKRLLERFQVLPSVRYKGKTHVGIPTETHFDPLHSIAKKEGTPEALKVLRQSRYGPERDDPAGFVDMTKGKRQFQHLSRKEAARLVGTEGESQHIAHRLEGKSVEERVKETRRGRQPFAAERLLKKRKQTQRLMTGINQRLKSAEGLVRAKLLNRKALVKGIGRRAGYLGVILGASDVIQSAQEARKK